MKKILALLVALVAAVGLAACGEDALLENPTEGVDYWVAGQYSDWGISNEDYMMEAIKLSDSRVASIKDKLSGAKYLYIKEVTFVNSGAGWTFGYKIDGEEKEFDGNMAVKVLSSKLVDDENGEKVLVADLWTPDPHKGEVGNLTPDTLYIPPYRETDPNNDGAGTWDGNPACLTAGTYYVVFVSFDTNHLSRSMGLVAK